MGRNLCGSGKAWLLEDCKASPKKHLQEKLNTFPSNIFPHTHTANTHQIPGHRLLSERSLFSFYLVFWVLLVPVGSLQGASHATLG